MVAGCGRWPTPHRLTGTLIQIHSHMALSVGDREVLSTGVRRNPEASCLRLANRNKSNKLRIAAARGVADLIAGKELAILF